MKRDKIILIAVANVLFAAVLFVSFQISYNPDIPYLKKDSRAAWIRYPSEFSIPVHEGQLSITFFEKNFSMEDRNKTNKVEIFIKSLGDFCIAVNGKKTDPCFASKKNWKEIEKIDISGRLANGSNSMQVIVKNQTGPPLLFLYTKGLGKEILTDSLWKTSIDQVNYKNAEIADDSAVHEISKKFTSPVDAFKQKITELAYIFILTSVCFLLYKYRNKAVILKKIHQRDLKYPVPFYILMLVILTWTVLFLNNYRKLFFLYGFDSVYHIEYILYIFKNTTLPKASDGWEMYQPPLYYILASLFLKIISVFNNRWYELYSLKIISFICGLGQICLAYAASVIVFPRQNKKQVLTVIAASVIPMNIYMSHYISNEPLSAFLIALSIVITIKLVSQKKLSPGLIALLGIITGLGLLAKFTMIIAVPIIFAAVLIAQLDKPDFTPAETLKIMLLLGFAIIIVSGWFYARNYYYFGSPVVGNWDKISNNYWWQDPGFHSARYFTRFGAVFEAPFFSGFYSFADSVYSTFWGDGYLGGVADYESRPSWNYIYMAITYLAAIPFCLFTAGGLFIIAKGLVSRFDGVWFLIVGSILAACFGIFYMTLKLPYYAQAKAFYGLFITVPVSLVFVKGFDYADEWLAKRKRTFFRMLFYGWFAVLCAVVYRSFFI